MFKTLNLKLFGNNIGYKNTMKNFIIKNDSYFHFIYVVILVIINLTNLSLKFMQGEEEKLL